MGENGKVYKAIASLKKTEQFLRNMRADLEAKVKQKEEAG